MKRVWQRCTAILVSLLVALTTVVFSETGVMELSSAAMETIDTTNPKDIQISTVEVELDQLIKDHYLVTVPITMPKNTGFEILQFGVVWDARMAALGARSTGNIPTPIFTFSKDKQMLWMVFMGNNCKATDICSVTFQLDTDVQAGDFLTIDGTYQDYNQNKAWYSDKRMIKTSLNLISGGISIVDDVVPEVTLEIGDVKAQMKELEENDYVVEVPVRATANNGFCDMLFGVTWDTSQLISEPPSGSTPQGISLIPSFDNATGVGWIHVIADSTYTGSEICTLRFRVPENTSPGDSYQIKGCLTSQDTNASVSNRKGDEGILNIAQDGMIHVTSTQPVNNFALGKISLPQIEVTPEELEASDYLIKVPICISQNSAFTQLGFGVSWDTNDLNIVDCTCDDEKSLGMLETYYEGNNGLWLPFVYHGTNGAYVGTALCTLTFRVRQDVMPGDKITLTADDSNEDGETAVIVSTKGETGSLDIVSGVIQVVSEQDKSAIAAVKVGDVEVSMDDLWLYDYHVTIPLKLTKNEGFSSIAFGVSWDSNQALPMEAKSYDTELLGLRENFYAEQDMAWLNFICVDPYEDYVYSGTMLGTLILELSEDVQPGDVIPVYAVNTAKSGSSASAVTANGGSTIPLLESGSIRITGDDTTTTDASSTTMPSEKTTTISSASAAASTEKESTQSIQTSLSTAPTSTTNTQMTTFTTETTKTTSMSVMSSMSSTTTAILSSTATQPAPPCLEQTNLRIRVGQTVSLRFLLGEEGGEDCVWLSDNPDVATVSVGKATVNVTISGVAAGITNVMVLYQGEIYSCEVTVTPAAASGIGDINLDNNMDMTDLVLLNKCIVHSLGGLPADALANADLNGDGYVDCKDALLLMQELLKVGLL